MTRQVKRWTSPGVVLLSGLVLAALTVTCRPVEAATLVDGGANRTTIVLEREPSDATRQAAGELADYLQQISGAEVPIVREGQGVDTPVTIYVGLDHPNLQQLFPDLDLSMDAFEQLVMAAQGDNLLIAGRDEEHGGTFLEEGTSRAIYAFLEDQLGVRWLWPGELGTVVPYEPTVVVDDFTDRFAPPLQQRYMRILNYDQGMKAYMDRAAHPVPEAPAITEAMHLATRAWRTRQRVDRRWIEAGLAFTDWWKKHHETHPDYFAVQPDGTREPYPSPSRTKLDISNPAVADRWMADAAEQLAETDHNMVVISARPNDSEFQGYCVCERCEAWDAQDGPMVTLYWRDRKAQHVALTDRFVRFWNMLANRIKAAYPDRQVYVGVSNYGAYFTPPLHDTLADNIILAHEGDFPEQTQALWEEDKANWLAWSERASHISWRPNFFWYDRGMPRLFMHNTGEVMSWLTDHKMIGVDMDSIYGHWALQGVQYYVTAKLAWNPYADVDEILDDYMLQAFGPGAAPAMRQFFDGLEQACYRQYALAASQNGLERISSLPQIRPPKFMAEMQSLLDQAKQAVGDGDQAETYRKRIDFFQTGLDFTKLQLEALASMNALRAAPDSEREAAYEEAVVACRARDAYLDSQLDSYTINTVWEYQNWYANPTIRWYFGPPSPEMKVEPFVMPENLH